MLQMSASYERGNIPPAPLSHFSSSNGCQGNKRTSKGRADPAKAKNHPNALETKSTAQLHRIFSSSQSWLTWSYHIKVSVITDLNKMASHTVSFFCPNFHLSENLNKHKCLQTGYRMFTQTLKPNDNGQVCNSYEPSSPRSGQCPSSLASTWMRLGVQVAVDMRRVFSILEREKVIHAGGGVARVLTSSCLCILPGGWRKVFQKGKCSGLAIWGHFLGSRLKRSKENSHVFFSGFQLHPPR